MAPKQFKPPRPSAIGIKKSNSKPKTSTTKSNSTSKPKPKHKFGARTSTKTHAALPSLSPDSPASSENDLFQSPAASDTDPAPPSPSQEVEEGFRNRIPPDLLTRLLHEFFGDNTRVQQDAGKAVGMYIETFIREAVARAAYERMGGLGHGAGNGIGGGFLEVEDLEKLAPQLLLDF